MAKTTYWNGSTSVIDLDSNWTNGAPVDGAGDTCIIDGELSSQAIDTDFTYPTDVAEWKVKNFTANIGNSGAGLANLSADKMVIYSDVGSSTGTFYLQIQDPLTQGASMDAITVNSDNQTDALVLTGDGTLTGLTELHVVKGGVDIGASCPTIVNLITSYRSNPKLDARISCPTSTKEITTIRMNGGIVQIARLNNSIYTEQGILTLDISALNNVGMELHGGTVIMNATSANVIHLHDGVLDCKRSRSVKTITKLYKYPRTKFLRDENLTNVTTMVDMTGLGNPLA